jgi:hypothetical protein
MVTPYVELIRRVQATLQGRMPRQSSFSFPSTDEPALGIPRSISWTAEVTAPIFDKLTDQDITRLCAATEDSASDHTDDLDDEKILLRHNVANTQP